MYESLDHRSGSGETIIPKAKKSTPKRSVRIQYGALPYRINKAGVLEVLLLTTRGAGRWIIPKGAPMKGLKPPQSAAQEAYEEAGVKGNVRSRALGTFNYSKRLGERLKGSIPCEVKVFPLRVKRQAKTWPEATERQLRWLAADDAAALVGDEGLRSLILSFAPRS